MKRRNWLALVLVVALASLGALACGEDTDAEGGKRACTSVADCKGGEVCGLDGYCAEMEFCTTDAVCGYGRYCTAQQFCQVATICTSPLDCEDASLDCIEGFCLPKPQATGCQTNQDCGFDEFCDPNTRTCKRRPTDSDGDTPDGDTDGDDTDGDDTDGDVVGPVCGNGTLETGEECENDSHCTSGKTCNTITCECEGLSGPVCGNGIVETGEQCENNSHCTGGQTCNTTTCQCEGGGTGTDRGAGQSCTFGPLYAGVGDCQSGLNCIGMHATAATQQPISCGSDADCAAQLDSTAVCVQNYCGIAWCAHTCTDNTPCSDPAYGSPSGCCGPVETSNMCYRAAFCQSGR